MEILRKATINISNRRTVVANEDINYQKALEGLYDALHERENEAEKYKMGFLHYFSGQPLFIPGGQGKVISSLITVLDYQMSPFTDRGDKLENPLQISCLFQGRTLEYTALGRLYNWRHQPDYPYWKAPLYIECSVVCIDTNQWLKDPNGQGAFYTDDDLGKPYKEVPNIEKAIERVRYWNAIRD